jgi:hypothetical protein
VRPVDASFDRLAPASATRRHPVDRWGFDSSTRPFSRPNRTTRRNARSFWPAITRLSTNRGQERRKAPACVACGDELAWHAPLREDSPDARSPIARAHRGVRTVGLPLGWPRPAARCVSQNGNRVGDTAP